VTLVVWLRLGRVSNLPTVWSNALAGSILSGAEPSYGFSAALAGALSLYYVGGMYLNDAFDHRSDQQSRPERPIPAGLVSATAVFALGFGMLASAVLLTWWLAASSPRPERALLSGMVLAALIVLYDAYHKQNPLSPLVMGLCRVMVYVTAAYTVTGTAPMAVWLGALALLCHLIGLTYAAKQENLASFTGVWPLAFFVVPVAYGLGLGLSRATALGFFAVYTLWLGYSLYLLMPGRRRSIPGAVVRLIAGISFLDGLLLAAAGATELGLVALALGVLTRLAQRFVPGT
jgi:hypothetical protein